MLTNRRGEQKGPDLEGEEARDGGQRLYVLLEFLQNLAHGCHVQGDELQQMSHIIG